MPKKHTPTYTTTKANYVHPSLQSSRPTTSSAPATSQTVNQRIAQLRREQAPRATAEQRNEISSLVSSRTVPPDLRRILHIPEVNAPKPKAGTMRQRPRGPGGARPPPGPAAPSSWLHRSRYAPKNTNNFLRQQVLDGTPKARFSFLAATTEKDFRVSSAPDIPFHTIYISYQLNDLYADFLLVISTYFRRLEASSTSVCEHLPSTGSNYPSTNNTTYLRYPYGVGKLC
jgi:hypothetical protein